MQQACYYLSHEHSIISFLFNVKTCTFPNRVLIINKDYMKGDLLGTTYLKVLHVSFFMSVTKLKPLNNITGPTWTPGFPK